MTTTSRFTHRTKAAFMLPGSQHWIWLTWCHGPETKHAAIINKANEIGAIRWDFGNSDHGRIGEVNF